MPASILAHKNVFVDNTWEHLTISEVGQLVQSAVEAAGKSTASDDKLHHLQAAQKFVDIIQVKLNEAIERGI